jgi:transposase
MGRGFATNVKIREIIIKKYCQGKTVQNIANDLDVPKSTVGDIIKNYAETGELQVKGKIQDDRELLPSVLKEI